MRTLQHSIFGCTVWCTMRSLYSLCMSFRGPSDHQIFDATHKLGPSHCWHQILSTSGMPRMTRMSDVYYIIRAGLQWPASVTSLLFKIVRNRIEVRVKLA